MQTESTTVLFEHVASTLPDSLSSRKRLLTALRHVLPRNHPAQPSISSQLASIDLLETLQSKLPLKFKKEAA